MGRRVQNDNGSRVTGGEIAEKNNSQGGVLPGTREAGGREPPPTRETIAAGLLAFKQRGSDGAEKQGSKASRDRVLKTSAVAGRTGHLEAKSTLGPKAKETIIVNGAQRRLARETRRGVRTRPANWAPWLAGLQAAASARANVLQWEATRK
jgi:hypothetical protein